MRKNGHGVSKRETGLLIKGRYVPPSIPKAYLKGATLRAKSLEQDSGPFRDRRRQLAGAAARGDAE